MSATGSPPRRPLNPLLRLEPLVRLLHRLRLGWLARAGGRLIAKLGRPYVDARVEGMLMRAPIAERGYLEQLARRRKDRYLVELFKDAVRPGARVLDAGAHWGLFTLVAADRVGPQGGVVAFEPDSRSVERLRWNVVANDLEPRTRIIHAAVGDGTDGERPLFTHAQYESWSSLFEQDGATRAGTVRVLAADDALAGDAPFDIVKIDVEGAEVEALRGMQRILAEGRPVVFVECNPETLAHAGATVDELLAELASAGYRCQAIDETDGSLRDVAEALAEAPMVNLRCDPLAS